MAETVDESGGVVIEEVAQENVNAAVKDATFVEDLFNKWINLQTTVFSFVPEGKGLAVCMVAIIVAIILFFTRKLVTRRRRPEKKKQKQQRKESSSEGKKKV